MVEKPESRNIKPLIKRCSDALVGALLGLTGGAVIYVVPFFGMKRAFIMADSHWQWYASLTVLVASATIMTATTFPLNVPGLRVWQWRWLAPAKSSALSKSEGPEPAPDPLPDPLTDQLKETASIYSHLRQLAWLGGLVYIFLYCAAIALCRRLHLTLLDDYSAVLQETARTAGLIVVICACVIQVKNLRRSSRLEQKPEQKPEHERYQKHEQKQGHEAQQDLAMRRHPLLLGWLLILAGLPLCFGAWLPLAAIPGAYIGLRSWIGQKEPD